ncbi:peptidoglycan-binding protein [bacterium]|nr:MAG: peptidoglycan-binding protein [bacterium]
MSMSRFSPPPRFSTIVILVASVFLCATPTAVLASTTDGTISSTYRYAWGENIGWVDFGSSASAVHITDTALTGSAYGENTGWITLNPQTYGGVTNNAEGTLSGYAWSENAGWIDFSKVTIGSDGVFAGNAYSENAGWITFGTGNNKVSTDWRPASTRTVVATPAPAASSSSGGGGGGGGGAPFSTPVTASNVSLNIKVTPNSSSLPANGGSITYTYTISNMGVAPVLGVSVTDTACSPTSYISGDTNGDSSINVNSLYTSVDGVWASRNVNEVWTFRCTTKLATTTESTATVKGNSVGFPVEATARTTVSVGATAPTLITPITPPLAVSSPVSGLTSVQANAILSLLSSFGADSAVIASVRAVLFEAGTGSNEPSASTSSFTRDLDFGAKGEDVRALQNFLIKRATGFAGRHLSDIGASGYFGQLTRAALAEFQAMQGITPAVGYFGPKTRDVINNLTQ